MNQVPVAESKERENDLCDIKYPKKQCNNRNCLSVEDGVYESKIYLFLGKSNEIISQ